MVSEASVRSHASVGHAGRLPGRTLVTVTSGSSSVNKAVTANCPAGKKVVGAGGEILSGNGYVLITDVIPNQSLTSVTVQGGENSAWTYNWQVRAYAMCAPESSVGNLQRVTQAAANNGTSDSVKTATAECPDELRLYGTGFEINDANGAVFPERLEPDAGLTRVDTTARENGTFNGTWSWTAYAICGDPRATMTLVSASSAVDSYTTHGATTNVCPAGTTLTGAGFDSWGTVGWALVDRLSLSLTLDQVSVNAWEDRPWGLGPPCAETGYAICVS